MSCPRCPTHWRACAATTTSSVSWAKLKLESAELTAAQKEMICARQFDHTYYK